MRKLGYSDFAIQTEKLAARLILSCLLFPYPAIIQHCTVQKYPAFFVLSLEFTLRDHHILLVQCIVRVISAARFKNTWPAHFANFENEMKTSIVRIGILTKSDRRSSLHIVYFPKKHFNYQTRLEKKTAVVIKCW